MAMEAHHLLPQLPMLLTHSPSVAAQERGAAGGPQALQALPLCRGGAGERRRRDAPLPPWASQPAGLAWWRSGGSGGAGAAGTPEPCALLAVLGPGGELAVVDVAPAGRQEPNDGPAPGSGSAFAPTDLLRPPLAPLGAGASFAAAPGVERADCAEGNESLPWGPGSAAAGRRARLFVLAAGGRGGAAGTGSGSGWRLLALEERAAEEAVRALAARGEWDAALRLAAEQHVSADAVHQCAHRPRVRWHAQHWCLPLAACSQACGCE